jgi:hypothetical protein
VWSSTARGSSNVRSRPTSDVRGSGSAPVGRQLAAGSATAARDVGPGKRERGGLDPEKTPAHFFATRPPLAMACRTVCSLTPSSAAASRIEHGMCSICSFIDAVITETSNSGPMSAR